MRKLWDELAEIANTKNTEYLVGERELKTIRASAVQMENWFTACQELREEKDAAMARVQEQDNALHAISDLLQAVVKVAKLTITMDEFGTGAKDGSMFKNIMATAYGLNSVGGDMPIKRSNKKSTA